MAAPVLYTVVPIVIGNGVVTTSEEAVLVSLFGCILFLLWFTPINGLAAMSRRSGGSADLALLAEPVSQNHLDDQVIRARASRPRRRRN